jgi:hypothetical protein
LHNQSQRGLAEDRLDAADDPGFAADLDTVAHLEAPLQ